jgi:hypothetical protein
MFELKRETHTVRGVEVTIQELTSGVLAELDESASALVAASLVPELSRAEVAEWPSEVVLAIGVLASKLNGFDEGKG